MSEMIENKVVPSCKVKKTTNFGFICGPTQQEHDVGTMPKFSMEQHSTNFNYISMRFQHHVPAG